jgi:hypothetical protein
MRSLRYFEVMYPVLDPITYPVLQTAQTIDRRHENLQLLRSMSRGVSASHFWTRSRPCRALRIRLSPNDPHRENACQLETGNIAALAYSRLATLG